ncbi:MAG: PQQ-binding-like beta-propeller repeat protein, partial [Planctomycetaceae bacterium]
RRITAWSFTQPEIDWTYTGPMSHANADPVLLGEMREERREMRDELRGASAIESGSPLSSLVSPLSPLFLVIDGDTLVRLSPQDGRVLWSRRLAHRPIHHAAERIALDDDSIYAASAGILRCLSRTDGSLRWERYVGPRDVQWRTIAASGLVIAVPLAAADAREEQVIISDATTGRRVQSFALSDSAGTVLFDPHPWTTLLAIEGALFGLSEWER